MICACTAALLLCSCRTDLSDAATDGPDSLYTAAHIEKIALDQPEEALALLDEAEEPALPRLSQRTVALQDGLHPCTQGIQRPRGPEPSRKVPVADGHHGGGMSQQRRLPSERGLLCRRPGTVNCPPKVGHKSNFMSKKYTLEEKLRVIDLYKRGLGNRMISRETGCERSAVKWWLRQFRTHGESYFIERCIPRTYDDTFKESVVREVLEKGLSLHSAATKFGINRELARNWTRLVKEGGYESLMKKRKKNY